MNQSNAETDYWADRRALEAAKEAKIKDQLVIKLKDNRVLSDEKMGQFKHDVVKHFKEHRWIGQDRQLELDQEYDRISLHFFVPAIINYMENHVPNHLCIQIFEDVLSAIPLKQEEPTRTEPTLRENPETPFSASRAEPRFIKSNAQLIDALASAINLEPGRAISIRGSITWADSVSGGKHYTSGMYNLGYGIVSGGRLGRDHMLSDVPNHYARDRLMDYINTQLEEDQRERARLAVFSDLSPAEIGQYSVLVMQMMEKIRPKTDAELIALVAGDKPIKTDQERARVLQQGSALEDVYQRVDLTPKPGFATRTYDRPGPIIYSVAELGLRELTPAERDLDPGTDIDRDCDQIRAMIAIFANRKEGAVDQFRLTLGQIDRKDLTTFLCKDGPKKGNRTIFQLAWEFFKRREILGLPLTDTPDNGNVLQECDTNTGKRSSAEGDDGNTRGKRTRRS
ncbi:hypothetical protein F4781DRAFT_96650 [Annulohypoxylon bovei var. microspora]|nr:hypothetical protein F4781DRAFT_96650 [Annulohypoxylon bovei var. microspora]